MPKQQKNIRISDLTNRQLDDLKAWWGITNETEIITVLIDRAWQVEDQKLKEKV